MKNIINRIYSLFEVKHVEVEGTWKGFYKYDTSAEPLKHRKIGFTANISLIPESLNFVGKIEESKEGIPEISEITGSIRGNKIEFSKRYKNFYEIDELGNRTIHEGPLFVYYTGIFNNSQNAYIGQWRIRTIYEYTDGKKITNDSTGHWEMNTTPANRV